MNEIKYKERYDKIKKLTFEEYMKIKRKQNKWLAAFGIIFTVLIYLIMALGVYTWVLSTDEVSDNAAFLNIGKNLCLDIEQGYAKMEIFDGGKVVVYCEDKNIIFER